MKSSATTLLTLGVCCAFSMENNTTDPLIDAIEENDIQKIEKLIQKGSSFDYVYPENGSPQWTPLGKAASWNAVQIVELLLKNGADPNKKFHTSPLIIAAKNGHIHTIELLLAHGANINEVYGFTTALYAAIQKARYEPHNEKIKQYGKVIALLIGKGANLEQNLQHAITYADPWNCLSLILWGADPYKTCVNGNNAFEFIEKNNHPDRLKLKLILQAGNVLKSIQSLWNSCCSNSKKDKYE